MSEDFLRRLGPVVRRAGHASVERAERLSGGANMQLWKLVTPTGKLCLRRRPGAAAEPSSAELSVTLGPRALQLAEEAQVMRAAGEAGVLVPAVLAVLLPADGLGDGFVMGWCDGETLGHRITRHPSLAAARDVLPQQAGAALAKLHSMRGPVTGCLASETTAESFDRWHRLHRRLTTAAPRPALDFAFAWLRQHMPAPLAAGSLAVVHGDFRNGNLVVGREGLRAVLDWEGAHVGDPAEDLGWFCVPSWRFGELQLPAGGVGSYDQLLGGYAAAGGKGVTLERVQWWELFGAVRWGLICLSFGRAFLTVRDPSELERGVVGRRGSEAELDALLLVADRMRRVVTIPPQPAPAPPPPASAPDAVALLEAVQANLRGRLAKALSAAGDARAVFEARVAANAVGMAIREVKDGGGSTAREQQRLRRLLRADGTVHELRPRLRAALDAGSLPLSADGLLEHLLATTADQLRQDQPQYPSLRAASRL